MVLIVNLGFCHKPLSLLHDSDEWILEWKQSGKSKAKLFEANVKPPRTSISVQSNSRLQCPVLQQPHFCQNSAMSLWFNDAISKYQDYTASMIGWLMNTEQLVEWELARETKVLGRTLLTLSTTNPTWYEPGSIPGRHGRRPTNNCLDNGTAERLLPTSESRQKTLLRQQNTRSSRWFQQTNQPECEVAVRNPRARFRAWSISCSRLQAESPPAS
jgi:hypothetical protein